MDAESTKENDDVLNPRDNFDDKAGVKSDAGRDQLLKQSSTIVTVDPMEYEKDLADVESPSKTSSFRAKVFKEEEKGLESTLDHEKDKDEDEHDGTPNNSSQDLNKSKRGKKNKKRNNKKGQNKSTTKTHVVVSNTNSSENEKKDDEKSDSLKKQHDHKSNEGEGAHENEDAQKDSQSRTPKTEDEPKEDFSIEEHVVTHLNSPVETHHTQGTMKEANNAKFFSIPEQTYEDGAKEETVEVEEAKEDTQSYQNKEKHQEVVQEDVKISSDNKKQGAGKDQHKDKKSDKESNKKNSEKEEAKEDPLLNNPKNTDAPKADPVMKEFNEKHADDSVEVKHMKEGATEKPNLDDIKEPKETPSAKLSSDATNDAKPKEDTKLYQPKNAMSSSEDPQSKVHQEDKKDETNKEEAKNEWEKDLVIEKPKEEDKSNDIPVADPPMSKHKTTLYTTKNLEDDFKGKTSGDDANKNKQQDVHSKDTIQELSGKEDPQADQQKAADEPREDPQQKEVVEKSGDVPKDNNTTNDQQVNDSPTTRKSETAKDLDTQEIMNEEVKQEVLEETKNNDAKGDKSDPELEKAQIKLNELMRLLEEAETLRKEGNDIFQESSNKTDDILRRSRDKYLKSSERLLTKSGEFLNNDAVKDLYTEAMKSALMNAGMTNIKLKEYGKALEVLKFSKQFFGKNDNLSKLNYRIAASLNGLERYREALEVLEPIARETKDPLIKMEYQKAYNALKEQNKATKSEKDTYAKMFNPDTRKEVEQLRKEEKEKEKVETSQDDGSVFKYLTAVIAIAGAGYLVYKALKK